MKGFPGDAVGDIVDTDALEILDFEVKSSGTPKMIDLIYVRFKTSRTRYVINEIDAEWERRWPDDPSYRRSHTVAPSFPYHSAFFERKATDKSDSISLPLEPEGMVTSVLINRETGEGTLKLVQEPWSPRFMRSAIYQEMMSEAQ
jgi:hypothetical protein